MKKLRINIWTSLATAFLLGSLAIFSYFFIYPRFIASQADLQEGDLIFQALSDRIDLVRAIEGISGSPYSHCGIVVKHDGELKILEAMGTVSYSEIPSWIARGRNNKVAVYRFKKEFHAQIPQLISNAQEYIGKPYDVRYEFGKEAIYCSELIYHSWFSIHQRDLGIVNTLGELKWQGYEQTIYKYNKSKTVPIERRMLTPIELAKAPELEKVYDNGIEGEKKY